MLILRSRTLIPRTRDIKGGPLLLLLDDASEAGGTRLTVVPTSQINPDYSTTDVASTISKRVARISRLRLRYRAFQLI
jgi:hypothetical protein